MPGMSRRAEPILLSDQERVTLQNWARARSQPQRLVQRAKIILDVKCPASGEAERNHWPNLTRLRPELDEVKFVIADRVDWDFARRVVDDYELESRTRSILISPAWKQIDLQELANWILESGMNARMQLQMHKYIWGPDVHGV